MPPSGTAPPCCRTRWGPGCSRGRAHAESVAGKGAQVASITDSAVLRTQGLEQRRADSVAQTVSVLERQADGRDRAEHLDDDATAEDGEASRRRHYLRRVVKRDRYDRDLLMDRDDEGASLEREHLPGGGGHGRS